MRLLSCMFLLAACAGVGAKTLELRDVQNFSMTETLQDGQWALRLSGLAFHSALAVERVETVRRADALVVKVLLSVETRGKTGQFDFVVDVPPGVERVLFGEEGRQIWPRVRDQ